MRRTHTSRPLPSQQRRVDAATRIFDALDRSASWAVDLAVGIMSDPLAREDLVFDENQFSRMLSQNHFADEGVVTRREAMERTPFR